VKERDPDDTTQGSSTGMKGRQFTLVNKTVEVMLQTGYGVHKKQIVGAPHWIETERWDVAGVPGIRA